MNISVVSSNENIVIKRRISLMVSFKDPLFPKKKRKFQINLIFINGVWEDGDFDLANRISVNYEQSIGTYWKNSDLPDLPNKSYGRFFTNDEFISGEAFLQGEALDEKKRIVAERKAAIETTVKTIQEEVCTTVGMVRNKKRHHWYVPKFLKEYKDIKKSEERNWFGSAKP